MLTYIGKNDCVYFDVGGHNMLSEFKKSYLKNNCYLKNNTLFISHFDFDHISKYRKIHNLIRFSQVYAPHTTPKTNAASFLLSFFKNQNVPVHIFTNNMSRKFDSLEVKNVPHTSDSTENSKSLLLMLIYNKKRILLTGDLPIKFEPLTIQNVDVLKVAHHGSRHSTSDYFLNQTKPKTCIISVGKNRYGHPHPYLLARLRANKCAILSTEKLGSVRLNL